MRVALIAVGRLGRTAEAGLTSDYLTRASATGRALALGPFELLEVEAKRSDPTLEAEALLARLDSGDRVVACDERGRALGSRDFATRLAAWRDEGARRACLLIGGADGLADAVRARADLLLSFGALTWPHALARVMAAEQLYRATTLLAGSPYHRD